MAHILDIKNIGLKYWITAIAAATLCAAAGFFTVSVVGQQISQWQIGYGEGVAHQAAQRSRDAALNKDLLSLQVIVRELAEIPRIANATVYDLENKPLVKAGGNLAAGASRILTQPITVQDAVVGYLNITVNLEPDQRTMQQITLFFFLLTFSMIALILAVASYNKPGVTAPANDADASLAHSPEKKPTIPIVVKPIQPTADSHREESASPSEKNVQNSVQLTVCFHNLEGLRVQLNSSAFRSVCQRLESQLKGVTALYTGKVNYIDAFEAVIIFSGEDDNHNLLNAICCAYLLTTLNQHSRNIQVQFHSVLTEVREQKNPVKSFEQTLLSESDMYSVKSETPASQILVSHELLSEDSELFAKLIWADVESDAEFYWLSAIGEPYASLLRKQQDQLAVN